MFFRKPKGFKYVLHFGKYLSYLPCLTNQQRQHFYFNKLAKKNPFVAYWTSPEKIQVRKIVR